MPLSEYEQRVLEQLEQDLGQDPSLHRAMNRGPRTPTRVIAAVAGVVVGLGIVVIGLVTQLPLLGVAGFVIMVGVALWALLAPRKTTVPDSPEAAAGSAGKASGRQQGGPAAKQRPAKEHKDFMKRMEERWERRRETGDF
ncbi:DUF3040 domain-containing protein [uncultured Demequina sp.]|uniref:DUF3040 domain-containing protein n=1 Tax=uncultured Demequina sp. TaxID=693499 RepID=UPI0025EC4378|nr:DUF3040 domain-containing protein [uncultured Demequina sp.]